MLDGDTCRLLDLENSLLGLPSFYRPYFTQFRKINVSDSGSPAGGSPGGESQTKLKCQVGQGREESGKPQRADHTFWLEGFLLLVWCGFFETVICCVAQADLDPPASASPVLGLEACAAVPSCLVSFISEWALFLSGSLGQEHRRHKAKPKHECALLSFSHRHWKAWMSTALVTYCTR